MSRLQRAWNIQAWIICFQLGEPYLPLRSCKFFRQFGICCVHSCFQGCNGKCLTFKYQPFECRTGCNRRLNSRTNIVGKITQSIVCDLSTRNSYSIAQLTKCVDVCILKGCDPSIWESCRWCLLLKGCSWVQNRWIGHDPKENYAKSLSCAFAI